MPRLLLPVLAALALLAGSPARAQVSKDPLADDPRLSRKVVLNVEGLPVGDLLEELGKRTGISLGATRAVADEKVMVFGPSRSLREVLADLAALLNTTWERKPAADGKHRYSLFRGRTAQQREARLGRAGLVRMLERMEEQVRALSLTPAQLDRKPDAHWIRQRLKDPVGRLGTRLYACLSPAQKELLFTRERVHIPPSALSQQQREELRETFRDIIEEEREFAEKQRAEGFGVPVSNMEELERNGLTFTLIHSSFVQVMVQLNRSPRGSLLTALIDRPARWALPAHRDPYTDRPVPKDAVLLSPASTTEALKEEAWPDRLRRLAKESGRPVLSDYYRVPPQYPGGYDPATPIPSEAAGALDRLCAPDGHLWWTRGRTLLFRKRDFFTHRRLEVPDRWLLETIRRLTARKGHPTYADVGRVADLTPEQILGLNMLGSVADVSERHRAVSLQLFLAVVKHHPSAETTPVHAGGLSRETMQRITLTAPTFTPAQQRLVPPLLSEEERPVPPDQAQTFGGFILCPREETVEERGDYRYVPLTVTWGFNKAPRVAMFPNSARVCLPMLLPDDRRSRTRIEVLPETGP